MWGSCLNPIPLGGGYQPEAFHLVLSRFRVLFQDTQLFEFFLQHNNFTKSTKPKNKAQ
jgi:hypothetical protein